MIRTLTLLIFNLFVCFVFGQASYKQVTYKKETVYLYPYKHQFSTYDAREDNTDIPPVSDSLPDGVWVVYKPFPPRPNYLPGTSEIKKWEKTIVMMKKKPEVTAIVTIKNGKKNGPATFLRDNKLLQKGFFLNDQKDSVWVYYAQDDKRTWQYTFKNNRLNGNYQYKDGKHLLDSGAYTNDKKSGKWIEYYKNGKVSWERNYITKKGFRHGKYLIWGDYLHGKSISYNDNGSIEFEREYESCYTAIDDTIYYKNGKIADIYLAIEGDSESMQHFDYDRRGKLSAFEICDLNKNKKYVRRQSKSGTYVTFDVRRFQREAKDTLVYTYLYIDAHGDTTNLDQENYASGSQVKIRYDKKNGIKKTTILTKELEGCAGCASMMQSSYSLKSRLEVVEYFTVRQPAPNVYRDASPMPNLIGTNGTTAEQHDSIRFYYNGMPLTGRSIIQGFNIEKIADNATGSFSASDFSYSRSRFTTGIFVLDSALINGEKTYIIQSIDRMSEKERPSKIIKHSKEYNYSKEKIFIGTLNNGYLANNWQKGTVFSGIFFDETGRLQGPSNIRSDLSFNKGKLNGHNLLHYSSKSNYCTYDNGLVSGHVVLPSRNYTGIQATYLKGVPTGPYIIYSGYDTGTYIYFEKGLEQGPIKTWSSFETGTRFLNTISHAHNGYLTGEAFEYFGTGSLKTKATYRLEDSVAIHDIKYSCYGFNTNRTGDYEHYFKNGVLSAKGSVKDQGKTGYWISYYEDGAKAQEIWYGDIKKVNPYQPKDTVRSYGDYISYYPNGETREKGYIIAQKYILDCSQDRKIESADLFYTDAWTASGAQLVKQGNGHLLLQHLNGAKQAEGDITNGRRVGQWIFYDANGNPNEVGSYIEGKKDGRWIFGDLKGINFIDNQCFNDEKLAKMAAEMQQHHIKLQITIYEKGDKLRESEFNKDLDDE